MLKAIDYPYDFAELLNGFAAIRKQLRSSVKPVKRIKVALLGGVTTAHVKNYLELFLLKRGIAAEFWESSFNQYFKDAVDGNVELQKFAPDFTIIYTSSKNIKALPRPDISDEAELLRFAEVEINSYKAVWNGVKRQTSSVILQNNFEFLNTRTLGNLDGSHLGGNVHYLRILNNLLAAEIRKESAVLLHDLNYLASLVGLDEWHDPDFWFLYKYASSMKSFPYIAESLSGLIAASVGLAKKVLVLDADNTLWGGTVAEDGEDGIEIGNGSANGEAFLNFQNYCKRLKERGVLLGLLSKNDRDQVEAGLAREQNLLRISDFSNLQVNWGRKDQNMQLLSEQLKLSPDSMVYVDDNPAERELVQIGIPEASTPDVKNFTNRYDVLLDRNYFFEPAVLTADDLLRTARYSSEERRATEAKEMPSYAEFLKSLNMKASFSGAKNANQARIVQLIGKTNQFNLTGLRLSEVELGKYLSEPGCVAFAVGLKDKFGDHGLVSFLLGKTNATIFYIDLWVTSCRVLGKELELAMLDELVQRARKDGAEKIIGVYNPSAKNALVKDLYEKLGFTPCPPDSNARKWQLKLSEYVALNTNIETQNE